MTWQDRLQPLREPSWRWNITSGPVRCLSSGTKLRCRSPRRSIEVEAAAFATEVVRNRLKAAHRCDSAVPAGLPPSVRTGGHPAESSHRHRAAMDDDLGSRALGETIYVTMHPLNADGFIRLPASALGAIIGVVASMRWPARWIADTVCHASFVRHGSSGCNKLAGRANQSDCGPAPSGRLAGSSAVAPRPLASSPASADQRRPGYLRVLSLGESRPIDRSPTIVHWCA